MIEYCPGGELFFYLEQIGRFKESVAKFYAANILLAIWHLHKNSIIYRDLKPENVLVDSKGYLKLTDFGLSIDSHACQSEIIGQPSNSVAGTAEYMSPEILLGNGFDKLTDFWSLGCIIYEMLSGLPPFMHKNRNVLYRKIKYENPNLSLPYLSESAVNLCFCLL